MWATENDDRVMWRERQRIWEEVGQYVPTRKTADARLDPEKHLRGKMRQQSDLLEECKRSLHDFRQEENAEEGNMRRKEVLMAVMGRFKESNGFLIAPASWWPDEEIGGLCAHWVMIPTGTITFQRIKAGDRERRSEKQPIAPHVELVAVDAWGCQVRCTRCQNLALTV